MVELHIALLCILLIREDKRKADIEAATRKQLAPNAFRFFASLAANRFATESAQLV